LPEKLTLIEVATGLGVTRQALSAVLNGRAGVSAEMAVRLSKALGTSADLWLGLQMQYDLWQVRNKPMPRVQRLAAKKIQDCRVGPSTGSGQATRSVPTRVPNVLTS
jgi:addiction module HigA family antidote